MPRRKKNKRHRKSHKNKHKASKNDTPPTQSETDNKVIRNHFDDVSLGDNRNEIKTTPVNYSRSLNRKYKDSSLNVTNLNILFDSNLVYNNSGDVQIRNNVVQVFSTPVNTRSTQTLMKSDDAIVETPKISHVYLVEDDVPSNYLEKSFESVLNNKKLNNDSSKLTKFARNEVNVNPYLNKDLKTNFKEDGDVSFFSPQMFKLKPTSTPIDKMQSDNIVNYLKESLRKDSTLNNSFNIDRVESFLPDLSRHDIFEESNSSKIKVQALHVSHRRSFRSSPKQSRQSKSQSFQYTRRSSMDLTEKCGIADKMLTRLKKYSNLSAKWSFRVVDLCAQLGINLKNSLSSICNMYGVDNNIADGVAEHASPKCRCDEYRSEIALLNGRINALSEVLVDMRIRLDERTEDKREIAELTKALQKVREELDRVTEVRAGMEALKKEFSCLKEELKAQKTTVDQAAAPPPPPPPSLPPPPPPPPPPPSLLLTNTTLKINKKEKRDGTTNNKDSRPKISLEDILKVKLKKPSDRASLTPLRNSSHPAISLDMLRQVRLRPASRPPLRSDSARLLSETNSPLSTSPHSSLKRLLLSDNGVCKVKRLNRNSRYTFDSVHRKVASWNSDKRERNVAS